MKEAGGSQQLLNTTRYTRSIKNHINKCQIEAICLVVVFSSARSLQSAITKPSPSCAETPKTPSNAYNHSCVLGMSNTLSTGHLLSFRLLSRSTFFTRRFPIAATLRYLVYSLSTSFITTYRHPPTRLRPHCCCSRPGRPVLPCGDAMVHDLGSARRSSSPMA